LLKEGALPTLNLVPPSGNKVSTSGRRKLSTSPCSTPTSPSSGNSKSIEQATSRSESIDEKSGEEVEIMIEEDDNESESIVGSCYFQPHTRASVVSGETADLQQHQQQYYPVTKVVDTSITPFTESHTVAFNRSGERSAFSRTTSSTAYTNNREFNNTNIADYRMNQSVDVRRKDRSSKRHWTFENPNDCHKQRKLPEERYCSSSLPSLFSYEENSDSYLYEHEPHGGTSCRVECGYFRRLSGESEYTRGTSLISNTDRPHRNYAVEKPPHSNSHHSRNSLCLHYRNTNALHMRTGGSSDGRQAQYGDDNIVDVTSIELDDPGSSDWDGDDQSLFSELSKVRYTVTSATTTTDASRMSPVYRYPLG